MTILTQNFTTVSLYLEKYEDPRTKNWTLVSSPNVTLILCLLYLFCAKVLGPTLMKNRKPLDLKNIIVGYNIFQVIFSSWLFYEFCASGWLTGEYSFYCQPIDTTINSKTMRMVNAVWWYYISKFSELTETVFFILRKKFDQVNTLHVYHHGIMLMSGWLAVKYYPTGHGTFPGLLNTFVHVIMYTYYLLSSCGPKIQKYLWWKKYLTVLQMVQFVIAIGHNLLLFFITCNFPKIFAWYMILLSISFYVLFKNFYSRTYKIQKLKQ